MMCFIYVFVVAAMVCAVVVGQLLFSTWPTSHHTTLLHVARSKPPLTCHTTVPVGFVTRAAA